MGRQEGQRAAKFGAAQTEKGRIHEKTRGRERERAEQAQEDEEAQGEGAGGRGTGGAETGVQQGRRAEKSSNQRMVLGHDGGWRGTTWDSNCMHVRWRQWSRDSLTRCSCH